MTEAPNIYVIDDDEAVLLSVNAILSQHGYSSRCYASPRQFLDEAPIDCSGCVITDLQMPEISGIELQRRLRAANSPLSIVVVTGVADVPTAVSLMESGAVTLLEKPYDHVDLLHAVQRGLTMSRQQWERIHDEQSALQRLSRLTDEERKVMECMLAGMPNKTIAQRLQLSMRTVDRRRHAVLEKMEVKTAPELALLLGTTRLSQPGTAEFSHSEAN